MVRDRDQIIEQKLDTIIGLLRHLVALELARGGVTQQAIGRHLRVATATVVKMLRGIDKEKYGR